jgi:2-desacetyl-2-hydroxyethyl bacteriochlorophyllide A dehydrogenase
MQIRQVLFERPLTTVLETCELDTSSLGPTEIVIETEASLISQGTEGAAYQGLLMPGGQEWTYPQRPGYAHVGRVIEVGAADGPFGVGDHVFSMTPHVSHARIDTTTQLCVRVPEQVPSHLAVFTRLAMVSMSTLRTSTARLGDRAAVVGLGMVGNLAAQLCQIAGMTTTGIDVIAWRCDLARACGIEQVLLAPGEDDLRAEHRLVIEATGSEAGAKTGVRLVQRHGELSLVGSQWGKGTQDMDALRFLGTIFERYIHIRSGWEWQLPTLPTSFGPSSLSHNAESILGWLESGKLQVEPLLSHQISPDDAPTVYGEMVHNKDRYLGVVFDWSGCHG